MKKVELKVELYDDKMKSRAMKVVSALLGVETVSVNMKEQKMTLIGDMDPVHVVGKLRKLCVAEVFSVGPAEEEKSDTEEAEPEDEQSALRRIHEAYYNAIGRPYPYYYVYRTAEDDPNRNRCVIC